MRCVGEEEDDLTFGPEVLPDGVAPELFDAVVFCVPEDVFVLGDCEDEGTDAFEDEGGDFVALIAPEICDELDGFAPPPKTEVEYPASFARLLLLDCVEALPITFPL